MSIDTFRTDALDLEELLKSIGKGALQLPDFQRDWVWDDLHIRTLIASVSQGFPMGTLMVMETGGEGIRFFPRAFKGCHSIQREPELLMLDGQQRTTSLFLSLKLADPVSTRDDHGKEIQRFYYLDIKKCVNGADRLDAVISVPENKMLTKDFGRTVVLDLSTQEKEFENGMFPVNIIYDYDKIEDWKDDYIEYFKNAENRDELAQEIKYFNRNTIKAFLKYKVPVIILSKSTPKEAICQVFENVNTGGVRLTFFELLTATYAADNFRLRLDWNDKKGILKNYGHILDGVSETDFLTATTLLASYRKSLAKGSGVSCKRDDILNLSLEDYKKCSDDIINGMKKAAKFLHSQKIFKKADLPYQTQLIPLSAICACLENRFDDQTVKKKIARWFWCGVLGEMYGSANETRYALDIQNFMQWVDGGDEPVTIRDASFVPIRLLSLKSRNSAAYKGLMALMMLANCKDFISGDTIDLMNYFDDNIDIHHIFPKKYCDENDISQNKCDSIVNKAPLSARTNRRIGGNSPSIYLERIVKNENVERTALDEHLRSQMIDPELLATDNFSAFLVHRAAKLLDHIEDAMGKKIAGRDSEETVNDFGATLLSSRT